MRGGIGNRNNKPKENKRGPIIHYGQVIGRKQYFLHTVNPVYLLIDKEESQQNNGGHQPTRKYKSLGEMDALISTKLSQTAKGRMKASNKAKNAYRLENRIILC